jgi:SAM-dependent methyltransferase
MSFEVSADAYSRFIGRYSEQLAAQFSSLAQVRPGLRALDVGCGPGALTASLCALLGPVAVSAVDPSESFVSAARSRLPDVDIRQASAEALPFPDDTFDRGLAQLVVHFMADPVAGLAELARVTRPGGLVAACVWDHAGGRGPLSAFWQAARDVDPGARDESDLAGAREGHLADLFGRAGLHDVEQTTLTVRAEFADFADWWQPFTLGVGPAGDYVAALSPDRRERLRSRCAQLLPDIPFSLDAMAWVALGRPR